MENWTDTHKATDWGQALENQNIKRNDVVKIFTGFRREKPVNM